MIYEISEIDFVASRIWEDRNNHNIFCFYGEMGAGKTTLIKALCNHIGVIDDMSSPSFSIVNEYQCKDERLIYHFDFYRLNKVEEAFNIGIEEYFYSGEFCFIEWPERINEILPDKYLEININFIDQNNREIRLVSHG